MLFYYKEVLDKAGLFIDNGKRVVDFVGHAGGEPADGGHFICVFNLVECGLLNKQESDLKADFAEGFNFQDAFEENYTPEIHW